MRRILTLGMVAGALLPVGCGGRMPHVERGMRWRDVHAEIDANGTNVQIDDLLETQDTTIVRYRVLGPFRLWPFFARLDTILTLHVDNPSGTITDYTTIRNWQ